MTNTHSSSSIRSIDIAKFYAALCIVTLHSGFSYFYVFSSILFRFAVPFFFVSSGYFFAKGLEQGKSYRHYFDRLFIPLIIFEIVNIILEFIKYFMDGQSLSWMLEDMILHILFYPYGALWYVQASLIGAFILSKVYKKLNLALIMGLFLYMFALLCNNYYFLIENRPVISSIIDTYMSIFISGRNGLFFGFFFLALGAKCRQLEKKKITFLMLIPVILIYIAEIFCIRSLTHIDDGALFITYIVLIPMLFLYIKNISVPFSEQFCLLLRKLSTGIYYLHRPILSLMAIMSKLTHFYVSLPAKVIITIICSVIICLISYRKNNSLISRLLQ